MNETNHQSADLGKVNDPLAMRNTETATLKRIQPLTAAAPASSAAKKTIKLKPLPSHAPAPGTVATATIAIKRNRPQSASSSTIKLNEPGAGTAQNDAKVPPAAGEVQTGKPFISTATRPVVAPVPNQISNSSAETPVVSVAVSSPSVSKTAIPTSPTATMPLKSLKPKIALTPAGGTPAPAIKPPQPNATATTTVPRILSASSPTQTLKPVGASADAPVAPAEPQGATQNTIESLKRQSGLQGAKPAIKLEKTSSESSPAAEAPAVSASNKTLRLPPVTPAAETPAPAAATGDAEATKTVSIKKPLKLAKDSSVSTPAEPVTEEKKGANMHLQDDIKHKEIAEQDVNDEQQIKVNNEEAEQKRKEALEAAKAAAEAAMKKVEPNLFFTISAIVSLLIIGYMAYAISAQYFSSWQQTKIPVVGFEQIRGSSGK